MSGKFLKILDGIATFSLSIAGVMRNKIPASYTQERANYALPDGTGDSASVSVRKLSSNIFDDSLSWPGPYYPTRIG